MKNGKVKLTGKVVISSQFKNKKFAIREQKVYNLETMEEIFSTKERIRILKEVIFWEGEIGVNEISKRVKLSKGLVSKFLKVLGKKGILKKKGKKFICDSQLPLVKAIKILFTLSAINQNIFKKYKFIKSVGLYGSCAKGENTLNSDVDIWIKTENISQEDEINLLSELRKKIKNVKVLFLTDEKLNKLKKEDSSFYYSLYFGSIIIYGEKDGLWI